MKFICHIFLFAFVVGFSGCLKDDIITPSDIDINQTAILLSRIEDIGEQIITDPCPVLMNALQLYTLTDRHLIIDLRTKEEYAAGHINNAVNIGNKNLLSYLAGIDSTMQIKVICVDADGQSAAYYAALLRLYGYANAYFLNFGMASWNKIFSNIWLDVVNMPFSGELKFTDSQFLKNAISNLPANSFPKEMTNYDERVKFRISDLIQRGYVDTLKEFNNKTDKTYYIFCYGNKSLYLSGEKSSYPNVGHPENVKYYFPLGDLFSLNYLQTLPPDKPILIYCYNGQLSSVTMAYLKVIGYQVSVLMYGADYLFHYRMQYDDLLRPYSFSADFIMDFPYVK